MGMSQPFTFNMTANEVRFAFRSWHLSYLFALDLSFPTFSWVNLFFFFFFFCLMIPFYLHYLLERLSLSLGSLSLLASSPRQHQHIANFLREKKKKKTEVCCKLLYLSGLCVPRWQNVLLCLPRPVPTFTSPQHSAQVPKAALGTSTSRPPLRLSNLCCFFFPFIGDHWPRQSPIFSLHPDLTDALREKKR